MDTLGEKVYLNYVFTKGKSIRCPHILFGHMVQSMTAIRAWTIWQQNKPKLSDVCDQTNHIHFKLKGRFMKSGASLKILVMLLKPFRKKKMFFL